MSSEPVLGFAGLGLMGERMVGRLLAAGSTVTVWNRSPDKLASLTSQGASAATSLAELTEASDVIMLCLADTAAVEAVVFGEEGIAKYGSRGKVLVDFSSIDPLATPELARRLEERCGMHWIDAPVSGGTQGAEQGSLVIMAGGDAALLDTLRPLLAPLCKRLTHMGPSGAGQMTKLCNQMVVANNALVIAEMVSLCRSAGVAVDKLPEALAGGFADSLPFQILVPQMAAHDFTLKWKVATLAKDLAGAAAVAALKEQPVPMTLRGAELIADHAAAGFADQDLSTLIRMFEAATEE